MCTYTRLYVRLNVCGVVRVLVHLPFLRPGPPARPPAGVHSIKAAAVAPVAPPSPPRGAPPNLLPGRPAYATLTQIQICAPHITQCSTECHAVAAVTVSLVPRLVLVLRG